MIKYNNTNNASTTLTAWISPSSTTLIVENGDILPTAPFLLTLEHFDNEKVTVREIVKCIAKAWNILTIQRGVWTCVQDDSATPKAQNNTPHSFSVWDCASIYWTSEQVQDIQNEIEKKLNIDDFQAWTYVYGATSTWTDAYSVTVPWNLTSYAVGQVFRFMADVDNEWNATLNINGLWAVEIRKNHDQHLQSGDIEAGQIVEVAYDGTNFQMDSQIASVISLDDISSLSYNDTTCYAWEEIHENDLIVTNGNSFNPDRTDESTDVWGQTVNKYAIWFIGNWESADKIYIKGNFIEWFDPDSVTMNIESDDNWKPSWTVLNTVEAKPYFRWHWDESSFVDYDWEYFDSNVYPECSAWWVYKILSCFWIWNWQITDISNETNRIIKIKTNNWYIQMDFWLKTDCWELLDCTEDWLVFVMKNWNKTIKVFRLETPFKTTNAIINSYTFSEIPDTAISRLYMFDWWTKLLLNTDVRANTGMTKLYYIQTENPYNFSSYTAQELINGMYADWVRTTFFEKDWIRYHYLNWDWSSSKNYRLTTITESWEATITSTSNMWIYNYFTVYWEDTLFVAMSNGTMREFAYTTAYTPKKLKIPLSSAITTTRGTKYRLTIIPVVTWSVVDSVKIYDKEWEYYSECAVNDTNNVWSNVANRTPYIDSNCIKARYARKANNSDILTDVPCGFANWDFTELENVQYTFQGLKTWFNGLVPDTLYYYDWTGWITTEKKGIAVWKAVNENGLLFSPTRTVNSPFSITSTWWNKTITAMCDETALIMWEWNLTVTWDTTFSHPVSSNHYFVYMKWLKKWEVYTFQVSGYTSWSTSYPGEATITFY